RNMVTRWGMSDKLGLVQLAPKRNPYLSGEGGFGGEKPFSEETAKLIDAEVHRLIRESHHEALRLLREHRRELAALVAALLEDEILEVTGLPAAPALEERAGRSASAV